MPGRARTVLRSAVLVVALVASLGTGTARAAAASTLAPEVSGLPPAVLTTLAAEKLSANHLSVWVQAVDSPRPLLAHNPDEPRNPASVMKLVTTLAALDVLGPGYRWQTRIYAGGPVRDGVLHGDLHLRGGGDPLLVTERFWLMLRRLRDQGIQRITGDLVIDQGFFAGLPEDPGDFDGRRYHAYNTLPVALAVNFNATRFSFWPDEGAKSVRITLDPPNAMMRVDNGLRLVGGACRGRHRRMALEVLSDTRGDHVAFAGEYPASCGSYELVRSLGSADVHAFGVFKALWSELGGRIDGRLRNAAVPRDATLLLAWESEPLGDVIRGMNKHSNNLMTRQLLLTMGVEREGPPGTEAKGRRAVDGWLLGTGVAPGQVEVDNGSGLSRAARITARVLGHLLVGSWGSPLMPEFVSSLPLSAVDGTMRRRFKDEALAGRLHMKTGLLNDVRALAGYLHGAGGRVWAVVVLHNEEDVHIFRGTRVQDALLEWLDTR
ncbi:MAG: D-alanyl-D-alanine carboxypeptidase/D-alanyl-D-alanine-endopeptidase [Ectothiorhodospiraceae bacterium]|nr:D-alanyl-D-alanine carboxypeptidase/D-alanyl-D-alanine-endopeptidase [Ectothiorhodospiraceae bacterium]